MAAQRKPGSKPYRDQLRRQLTQLGLSGQALIEQIARDLLRCGMRPREAWRSAAELTQDETAARFNTITGNPRAPMRGTRICEYEKWPFGGVRPPVKALKIMADIYGTTWDQLVDAEDLRQAPDEDRATYVDHINRHPPTHRPSTDIGLPDLVAREDAGNHPEQMTVIAAEESQTFGEWVETSNVGETTLEQYAAQARRIAHDYIHAEPFPLLLRTRRLRNRVFATLRGHQQATQTRDLYLVAGQACGLLAWMSGDLGNYAAADTHAWTAWVCAEQADHDGARAWIRVTQSKLAYWDHRYLESVQLAEDGLRYSCDDSGTAMLALLHARALARAGRHAEADQALGRAQDEYDRAAQPDELGGLWGMSAAQFHYLAGTTNLWRHEPDRALIETEQSIALFEATPEDERFYGAEMLARVDQAQAYLQRTELDGVEQALRPVLTLAPDQRIETITQSLRSIGQALARSGYREDLKARELQEEIETYRREAVVNDLLRD